MYRDKDGDYWYFADIDPPEHYHPHKDKKNYVVWCNYITNNVFLYDDRDNYWALSKIGALYQYSLAELTRARKIKEINGYR